MRVRELTWNLPKITKEDLIRPSYRPDWEKDEKYAMVEVKCKRCGSSFRLFNTKQDCCSFGCMEAMKKKFN